MDRDRLTTELRAKFEWADSWRRSYYDEIAIQGYKNYIGFKEALPPDKAGRSNLFIPRTYEELDAIRARLIKTFFSTRPYIDMVPMPRNLAEVQALLNTEKGEIATALIDQQFEKNQIFVKMYEFITTLLFMPAAILAVGWRYEQREMFTRELVTGTIQIGENMMPVADLQKVKKLVTVWDDNEIVNVDYFDFWPDPRGTDIDDCRFVFQREWVTEDELIQKLDLLREIGAGTVFDLDFQTLRGTSADREEGRWERMREVGNTPETGEGIFDEDMDKTGHMYELLHYWEDGAHGILVNLKELAYFGDNPYWRHGKKPYIVAGWEPLPREFYFLPAARIIEHLQAELNTQRNQRIDNVSFVLNRMWKVRNGAEIDESELISRPHGIVHVNAMEDVEDFKMQDVTASAYRDEEIIKQDMENALGVPAVVRGVNPDKRETATEVVTKNSNAGIRFDVKIMLFEWLGLKRLAYLMDCNNQQFLTDKRLVKLFGKEGVDAWREIEPYQLLGEYDYRPAGSSNDPAANKEIRRQQLTQVMEVVAKMQNPYIDMYELTKLWIETFDIRNVEKFLKTPEQIQQEQLQKMLQAMPAQGQTATAASPVVLPPAAPGVT